MALTETAGNKRAWIIGNLSPGNKHCNTRWAQRYNAIIERYQKVVVFQHFGHDEKEYFQLQYPTKGPSNPFGVMFQGGKATSLNQNPRFKIIEFDADNLIVPVRISVYEYNIQLASEDATATPQDLIRKVRIYPNDLGMSSLRPSDFQALSARIKNNEKDAVDYMTRMCQSEECIVSSCDETCRNDLACQLDNSNPQDILACRGYGLQDRDYGFDYLLSMVQNPWVEQKTKT